MKWLLPVLFVLAAACPALGRELLTRHETPVYEKPDLKAKVLAQLAQNVKVTSDAQEKFWFRVSVELDGKTVEGWVNQADVDTMMGRSKGQLLVENESLLKEVAELRKKVAELQEKVAELQKAEMKFKEEMARLSAERDKADAKAAHAQDEINDLKQQLKNKPKDD